MKQPQCRACGPEDAPSGEYCRECRGNAREINRGSIEWVMRGPNLGKKGLPKRW